MKLAKHNERSSFDSYSDRYDETVNAAIAFSGLKVNFFVGIKAVYLQEILRDHFGGKSDIDLLDVGCGVGNYHPFWVDKVRSLQGTDVSARSIARAREHNPQATYSVYDGARLPFADRSFDAIVAICVLHHVDPPRRQGLATEMRRVTKPGGLAVIFEHNPRNPLTRRVVSNCPFDEEVALLTDRDTEDLLASAGFWVCPTRFILTIPPLTKFLRWTDSLLSRLRLGAQYYSCGVAPD